MKLTGTYNITIKHTTRGAAQEVYRLVKDGLSLVEMTEDYTILRKYFDKPRRYGLCEECQKECYRERHHIKPSIGGGWNLRSNLVYLCHDCRIGKKGKQSKAYAGSAPS